MEYGHFKRRDNRGDSRDRKRGGYRERGEYRDRSEGRDAEESVFSKRVRAGKRRTYFFDVRQTKGSDYFITITESTRREDGYGYKRHKIFLYKEDFNRFVASLNEVVNHVKTDLMPEFDYEEFDRRQAEWEAQNRDAEDGDDYPDNYRSRFRDKDADAEDGDDEADDDLEEDDQPPKKKGKDDDDMSW